MEKDFQRRSPMPKRSHYAKHLRWHFLTEKYLSMEIMIGRRLRLPTCLRWLMGLNFRLPKRLRSQRRLHLRKRLPKRSPIYLRLQRRLQRRLPMRSLMGLDFSKEISSHLGLPQMEKRSLKEKGFAMEINCH